MEERREVRSRSKERRGVSGGEVRDGEKVRNWEGGREGERGEE